MTNFGSQFSSLPREQAVLPPCSLQNGNTEQHCPPQRSVGTALQVQTSTEQRQECHLVVQQLTTTRRVDAEMLLRTSLCCRRDVCGGLMAEAPPFPTPPPPHGLKLTPFFSFLLLHPLILSHHLSLLRLCPLLQQPNIKQKFVALLKRFKVTDEVRVCCAALMFAFVLPKSARMKRCVGATWQHTWSFSRRLAPLEADDANKLHSSPTNMLPRRSLVVSSSNAVAIYISAPIFLVFVLLNAWFYASHESSEIRGCLPEAICATTPLPHDFEIISFPDTIIGLFPFKCI